MVNSFVTDYFPDLIKGSAILHAISQIDSTLDIVLKIINKYRINARIVLTKVYAPALNSVSYIKLKKRISSLGGNIKQSSHSCLEEII